MPRRTKPLVRIDRLYLKTIDMIERDIGYINNLGVASKLSIKDTQALIAYVKLLGDLREVTVDVEKRKKNSYRNKASNMTDEQLEQAVKDSKL